MITFLKCIEIVCIIWILYLNVYKNIYSAVAYTLHLNVWIHHDCSIYCCWCVMSALSLVSWSLVVYCGWSSVVAMFSLRSHQRVYPVGVVLNRLTIPHVRHLTTMCFSLCANTQYYTHMHTYKLQNIHIHTHTWMHSINTYVGHTRNVHIITMVVYLLVVMMMSFLVSVRCCSVYIWFF